MTNNIIFPINIERMLDDDDTSTALRFLLIDPDDMLDYIYTPRARDIERPRILDAITSLDTDTRSLLMLALSLCPLHATDYAICFDDDDDECAALRACFPSHDT